MIYDPVALRTSSSQPVAERRGLPREPTPGSKQRLNKVPGTLKTRGHLTKGRRTVRKNGRRPHKALNLKSSSSVPVAEYGSACAPATDVDAAGGRGLRLRNRRRKRYTGTSGCENPKSRYQRTRNLPIPGSWFLCAWSLFRGIRILRGFHSPLWLPFSSLIPDFAGPIDAKIGRQPT